LGEACEDRCQQPVPPPLKVHNSLQHPNFGEFTSTHSGESGQEEEGPRLLETPTLWQRLIDTAAEEEEVEAEAQEEEVSQQVTEKTTQEAQMPQETQTLQETQTPEGMQTPAEAQTPEETQTTAAEAQTPEETQTPAEGGTQEVSRRLSRKVSLEVNRKVSLLKVRLLKVSRKPTQEILQDLTYCQPPKQNTYY
jgi:hypothetical protein